jgi:hypothetical protein
MMQEIGTYECHIKHVDETLRKDIEYTMAHIKKVLNYFIHIAEKEWDILEGLNSEERLTKIEQLTHATKAHPNPKYPEYDQYYNKDTYSVIRRSIINRATGIVQAYKTNYKNWENSGKKGHAPTLQYNHNCCISFYRDDLWRENTKDLRTTSIRLYNVEESCWEMHDIDIDKSDAHYITNLKKEGKLKCPTIQAKGKQFVLKFPIAFTTHLHNKPAGTERICAVDLGINTAATCVIMEPDGTILARKFINLDSDTAKVYKKFNQVRKAQSNGSRS